MWIQLEGKPSVLFEVEQSEYDTKKFNLDRLARKLQESKEFNSVLQNLGLSDIEFFYNNDRTTPLRSGMILTNDNTTDENPLIVRYPLSNSIIIVTYKSGNSSEKYVMPHSSGSWSLLRQDVIENFRRLSKLEEVEVHELCFEYSVNGKSAQIKDEFQFNYFVTQTEVKNGARILPDLKVKVKGKKPYSDWGYKEVLNSVLDVDSLENFDLEELPKDRNPMTEIELKSFVEDIEKTLSVFKKDININEMTVREYISIFMKTAVYHIQKTYETAKLCVGRNLSGKQAYGPLDYLVEIDGLIVLINKAKFQDILKGIAQMIMQLLSASEKILGKRKLDETEFDPPTSLFGIVSTGTIWVFIRWTGSPGKPDVKVTRQYNCSFVEGFQTEKEVVSHIVRILKSQQESKSTNQSKHVHIDKDDNEGSRDCAEEE